LTLEKDLLLVTVAYSLHVSEHFLAHLVKLLLYLGVGTKLFNLSEHLIERAILIIDVILNR